MFCKLALVIMLCVALQEADAACPSSISDQFTTVASSASEAAKKAACTALDVIIKNVPATGAGSIEKADLDDCIKKFEETNNLKCGCGTTKLSITLALVLAVSIFWGRQN